MCNISKKKVIIAGSVFFLIVAIILFAGNSLDTFDFVVHQEGARGAIIQDVNGHLLLMESIDDKIWEQIVQLYQNKTERWIGGIIEGYDNEWNFHFKPENITIQQATAEAFSGTIRSTSNNLDHWLDKPVYFYAKVVEIYSSEYIGVLDLVIIRIHEQLPKACVPSFSPCYALQSVLLPDDVYLITLSQWNAFIRHSTLGLFRCTSFLNLRSSTRT